MNKKELLKNQELVAEEFVKNLLKMKPCFTRDQSIARFQEALMWWWKTVAEQDMEDSHD